MDSILTGFSQPDLVRKREIYYSFAHILSKPVLNGVIAEGNDVGGVILTWGISLVFAEIFKDAQITPYLARLLRILIFSNEIIGFEIRQLLNKTEGTGTLTDLAIFSVPLFADIILLGKDLRTLKQNKSI